MSLARHIRLIREGGVSGLRPDLKTNLAQSHTPLTILPVPIHLTDLPLLSQHSVPGRCQSRDLRWVRCRWKQVL